MNTMLIARSRVHSAIAAPEKFAAFVRCASELQPPWRLSNVEKPKPIDFGSELISEVSLTPMLPAGIRGVIGFKYRHPTQDVAFDDDYLILEFDSQSVDFPALIDAGFMGLVTCFDAYRAQLGPKDLDLEVEEPVEARTGFDIFFPVNYLDEAFCYQVFKCGSEEVAGKARRSVERARSTGAGLELVLSKSPISLRQALKLDERFRASLRG